MKISNVICPAKFKFAQKYFKSKNVSILDIGCGNNSPSTTKKWFPKARYTGVDIQEYNLNHQDKEAMDDFYYVTTSVASYQKIPNEVFNFIIMNHVIEHMPEYGEILDEICKKLAPGGLLWIAFPSVRSLNLPSAIGTLNFCDDETHVFIPTIAELGNFLLRRGFKIHRAGRSHDLFRFLIGCFIVPVAIASYLVKGTFKARGLWYISNFEDRIIAIKL